MLAISKVRIQKNIKIFTSSEVKLENNFRIRGKCPVIYSMFILITDLDIKDTDDSTYFSITYIDTKGKPEGSLKFDKNSRNRTRWIQVRDWKGVTFKGHHWEITSLKTESSWFSSWWYASVKPLIKLPRSAAIFEFSTSNPEISFNVNYECRDIQLFSLSCKHWQYSKLWSYNNILTFKITNWQLWTVIWVFI